MVWDLGTCTLMGRLAKGTVPLEMVPVVSLP